MFRTISLIEVLNRMEPDVPITPRMLIKELKREEEEARARRERMTRADPLGLAFGVNDSAGER
jgi:hypothetical protein